jgi:hypothetical protein
MPRTRRFLRCVDVLMLDVGTKKKVKQQSSQMMQHHHFFLLTFDPLEKIVQNPRIYNMMKSSSK